MEKKQRFVADQRFDLPQYESMLGYIDAEFNNYNRAFISPENRILGGWNIENNGGLQVRTTQARDSFLFNSENTGLETIVTRQTSEDPITLDLADNSVNFVELQIVTETCAPDTVAIWDTTANAGEGEEFTQTVDTAVKQGPVLVSNTISFSGDPDKLQLAMVTTSGGVITDIVDSREILFQNEADHDFGVVRTDRTIDSIKVMYDAVTTAIREFKNTLNWYDVPYSNVKLLKEYQNMYFTGGGNIKFEGTAGADTLQWDVDFGIEIAGRSDLYAISAASAVILDGQALYVDIPEGTPVGPLTPIVVNIEDVPMHPDDVGFSPGLHVMFFRRSGTVYGYMDIPELSSGETAVIGIDLPSDIRIKLGIIDEATFEAYSATALALGVILAGDSLPTAISKLAANPPTIKVDYVDIISTVLPTGTSFTPDGSAVVDGERILFTNAALNAIYEVSGVGASLVWTAIPIFGGNNNPTPGDWVSVAKGATDYFKTHWRYKDSLIKWKPMESSDLENEPSGFPLRTNNDISFDVGTRTFSITPGAGATSEIVQTTVDVANTVGQTGTYTGVGQQITPAAGQTSLTHISFSAWKDVTSAGTFKYSVFAIDGSGNPTGVSLAETAAIDPTTLPSSNSGLQEYALTSPLTVIPGVKIALVLDAANITTFMRSGTAATDLVAGGTGLLRTGASSWGNTSSDRAFKARFAAGLGEYDYVIEGQVFRKDVIESIVIPDTQGIHFVYFDGETIVTTTTFNDDIIKIYAFVAAIGWDSTNNRLLFLADERHGITLDGATHKYLHNVFGTRYVSGLSAGNFTTAGDGTADADIQASISDGLIFDEDLDVPIAHAAAPSAIFEQILDPIAEIPIYHREGASGEYRKIDATQFALHPSGSGRATLNNPAGPWTLDEATDTAHVAMWVFATNAINEPVIAIMGQREDLLLADATANNTFGALLLGNFPILEFKVLYRLIFQTDTTYTNAVKSKLVDVLDLRADLEQQGVASPSVNDHALLSGLAGLDVHPSTSISTPTFDGGLSDADINVGEALSTMDKRLGQLRLQPHPTLADRVIITGADKILNSGITIGQELRNLLLAFDGAEIELSSGSIFEDDGVTPLNGGANDYIPLVIPANEYLWMSVQIIPGTANANNTIGGGVLVIQAGGTDAVLADAPRAAFGSNVIKLGELYVQESGGSVAAVTATNITQLGIGSGSGGGGIDEASLFLEDLKAFLRNEASPEWMTPNIIPLDADTKIDASSTGTFDVANNVYDMDAGQFLLTIPSYGSRFMSEDRDSQLVYLHALWAEGEVDPGLYVAISETENNEVPSTDGTEWNGQRFSPGFGGTLDKITFKLRRSGLTGTLKVNIYNDNGGGLPDLGAGVVLFSEIPIADVPTSNGDVEFQFANTLKLEPGTDYHAIMDTTGITFGGGTLYYRLDTSNPYSGGLRLFSNSSGASFITVPTQDMTFSVSVIDSEQYQVSIDGGATFEAVVMNRIGTSIKFEGHIEVPTPTLAVIDEYDLLNADTTLAFDNAGNQGYSVLLPAIAAGSKRKSIQATIKFDKIGAPVGDVIYRIVKDNGGLPTGDIIAEKRASIASMALGVSDVIVEVPTVLIEGTYWLQVVPSTGYVYSVGVNELGIRVDTSVLTYSEGDSFVYDGATWAADTGNQATFKLEGFDFDLRAKITGSQTASLVGIGLFYGESNLKSVETEPNLERIDVDGSLDVTEITLTRFIPNPATCVVWDTNTGQGYRFPAINFDGRKIIFASGQFLSPGETIPLVIDNGNGIMDNSDANAALLAANRLGSTDPTHDRSVAGEGLLQRADNGQLIEISWHWDGVSYVPVVAEV